MVVFQNNLYVILRNCEVLYDCKICFYFYGLEPSKYVITQAVAEKILKDTSFNE